MDFIYEGLGLGEFERKNLDFDGEFLSLHNKEERGYLETNIIEVKSFTEVSPSWNSRTDNKSFVELFIKVRVNGQWSEYKSYGLWATDGFNVGIKGNISDDLLTVTEDKVLVNKGEYADAVQIKVVLSGDNPKLKLIAFTTNAKEEIEEVKEDYLKVLSEVPQISQLQSGHIHANSICSPTSLTMALKYYGVDIDLFDVTKGVLDTGCNLYGNWPQNVAFAGECGMRAYVKKCSSINDVKRLISKDIPVVASIKTDSKEELRGSTMCYPEGHLIIIIGFVIRDGVEYAVVNDPAAKEGEPIRREYLVDELVKVWRGYIYVVTP